MLCEIIDDRAIRPVIALTVCDEMLKRLFHRFQLGDLELKRIDMFQCLRLDFRAGPVRVAPQSQKMTDTFNRKAEISGAMNRPKCMHISVCVGAIPVPGPVCDRDQAGALIIRMVLAETPEIGSLSTEATPLPLPLPLPWRLPVNLRTADSLANDPHTTARTRDIITYLGLASAVDAPVPITTKQIGDVRME